MGGRKVYHARGKVLGGSSSVNGMIFQRGNPLDYERWASRARDGDLGPRALPALLQADGELPRRGAGRSLPRPRRPARARARPARGPLFDAFFAAVQQAGYPLTEDVNGYRQEGFAAFDRNVHNGRRLSAARAYLHPVMSRPNLEVQTFALTTKILFEGGGRWASSTRGPTGALRRAAAPRSSSAAARSTRPSCSSSRASGPPATCAVGIDVVHDLPGVGENMQDHLEVYVQHSCTPAGVDGALLRDEEPAQGGARVAAAQVGPGRHQPLRGRRLRARQRRGRVPEPDVPLPADRGALRRHAAAGRRRPRLPGARRSDVLRRARHLQGVTSTDPRKHPALRFNYLSTENDRKEWVEAIRATRKILSQPAWTDIDGGELSPGAEVETDEQILDWVAKDAETALHPSCTCRWASTTWR